MPPLVFINYRRKDTQHAALALQAALESRFGKESVFLDVDDIQPGENWRDVLQKNLNTPQVLLVLIGPKWLRAADEWGNRRLSDPEDWVRKEILRALEKGTAEEEIPLIPLRISGEQLPPAQGLPAELRPLLDWESFELRDESWTNDVEQLIQVLVKTHGIPIRHTGQSLASNPAPYLRQLAQETAYIDIRGIQIGQERAHRFEIEKLFITLTTSGLPIANGIENATGRPKTAGQKPRENQTRESERNTEFYPRQAVPLEAALRHDRLLIIGDPGSGKTTFLRRITQALCHFELKYSVDPSAKRLEFADRMFPVFVRIDEFAQHLQQETGNAGAPLGDSPNWLPHFLAKASLDHKWGLNVQFFGQQLDAGQATVLFDGLDEAPDRVLRERVERIIEAVTRTYDKCRFVVTSRPVANSGAIDLDQFMTAQIDPLADEAVETFLTR